MQAAYTWALAGLKQNREFESCSLRHAVWTAEKLGRGELNMVENRRSSSDVVLKTDWRKCPALIPTQAFAPFSLEGTLAVRF